MTRTPETAAQLDTAIDAILRQRGVLRSTAEGELVATARLLRDALPRFHPRFGFEELLAARLAAARRRERSEHVPEPTPIRPALASTGSGADTTEGADMTEGADTTDGVDRRRRGLVAGGAIASGVSIAVPIAGAALVVWRRSRSSGGLL
jgi:hypothetical protein